MRTLTLIATLAVAVAALHTQPILPVDTTWVNSTLRSMTLEEKLGQLFIPVHRNIPQTLQMIENFNVGGIWFPRTEANKIASELRTLQRESKYPLLVTVDFEKGAGTYVDGCTDLPSNMALGASGNPDIVRRAAALTAKEARALGIHLNYAPVVDVNNNPQNPVINIRSYGEDPKLVAALGAAAVEGYQSNGLLATLKHFPGHGNVAVDSHFDLVHVDASLEELNRVELYPFREILKNTNVSSVMSAHLWIKALDKDTIPATLSQNVMTKLLRKELGFKGLVFTDAMDMGAIVRRFPYDEAVVRAIGAGNDIFLFAADPGRGIAALKKALAEGTITMARIDEAVRHILEAKAKVGLHLNRFVELDKIPQRVGTPEFYAEAKAISAECITLAKDTKKLLPLKPSQKVGVILMSNTDKPAMTSRLMKNLPEEMTKQSKLVTMLDTSPVLTADETQKAIELAKNSDAVVIGGYIQIVLSSNTIELPEAHRKFVRDIHAANPNVVLISFGNPYIISSVPETPAYIAAFDNCKAMQEVAAEALYGKLPFKGKPPVTIKIQ